MSDLRVPMSALPDDIVWFFEGQFAVADALRRGYRWTRTPWMQPGEIVIVHYIRVVAVAPDVFDAVERALAARAAAPTSSPP